MVFYKGRFFLPYVSGIRFFLCTNIEGSFFCLEETKTLQEEFAEKAKAFLRKTYSSDMELTIDELYEDLLQEIQWQVSDWYEGDSYYPKPEDILVDYLQLSPLDAHRFLPLFTQNCEGKDSCPI